jgi:hypothetical protein
MSNPEDTSHVFGLFVGIAMVAGGVALFKRIWNK